MTSTETRDHTTPRELWRALRRHPRDLPERLMVLAVTHQGPDAKAWARDRVAQGCTPRCNETHRAWPRQQRDARSPTVMRQGASPATHAPGDFVIAAGTARTFDVIAACS